MSDFNTENSNEALEFRTRIMPEALSVQTAHVSPRNAKMGNIPSFSTLPGAGYMVMGDGRAVIDVPGTCGGACAECMRTCYACDTVRRYTHTAAAYGRNTRIVRAGEWGKLERMVPALIDINDRPLFRWHVAGELETAEQAACYCRIMAARPAVMFGIYTRRPELLAAAFEAEGRPANICISISLYNRLPTEAETEQAKAIGARFFVTDAGAPELAGLPHCPAVDERGHSTGITCDKCRICYRRGRTCAIMAVTEH